MYSILVVDDEPELRKLVVSVLSKQGYVVDEACDGLEASQKVASKSYPLVLCDVRMPNMDGLEFLQFVRDHEFSTAVALITAHGSIRNAIEAIRQGAFDYIEKPISETALIALVKKAERAYEMLNKMAYSAPMMSIGGEGADEKKGECVGTSHSMKRLFKLIERLTTVNTSVLIRGENGTGKELVAKAIHFNSPRKDYPFVAINCGAIPENLVESELFGYEKGAFTGADQRKIGKFQFAAQGTIFLDEIGDTTPPTQVKLLRVLQEHSFTPVGANREIKADIRIIAATNQDLEKAVKEGRFREDLYYRLNVMPLYLPPLRERVEDIPQLVHHFIDKYNKEYSAGLKAITPEALSILEAFNWPGNIRELENAIEHCFVLETTDRITPFSLPEYIRKSVRRMSNPLRPLDKKAAVTLFDPEMDWEKGKESFEREFIVQALKHNRGRINLTADQANIPKNTLLRKIKKYSINPKEYGAPNQPLN